MGLFKSMKDLSSLTKEAKQLQRQQQEEAGYKPGFGGQMQQMGDMISRRTSSSPTSRTHPGSVADPRQRASRPGDRGGARDARARRSGFNIDIDLEVHVSGRRTYRVNNRTWSRPGRRWAKGSRPSADSGSHPAPHAIGGGGDHIAELERLAKLRDSGALTDAEFEQQKAKILGS